MKKLLLSLSFLLASVFGYTQITFERHYGNTGYDGGSCVLQTNDGGYIVAGETASSSGSGYIFKTNEYGDTLWTKSYGGNLSQSFNKIKKTIDNGYILCGETRGLGYNEHDYLLLKIDANGDTLWQKSYGGLYDENAVDVIQTYDGGYALTGGSLSYGSTNYFVKTNNVGDTLWTKKYTKVGLGTGRGTSLYQLADNGYIIAGSTGSSSLYFDIFLIRTNEDGDTLWTRTYGGALRDEAGAVYPTSDGGFIIFGTTNSFGSGNQDAYIVKTDSYGILQWQKTYGGINEDNSWDATSLSDGGYAFLGATKSVGAGGYDVYLIRINSTGDTMFTRTFGGIYDDLGCSVKETIDGGFIISGWSRLTYSGSTFNAYLIKTNADGHVAGIDDYTSSMNKRITVWPNPTTGQLTFQIPNKFGQTKTLEILDCVGQLQLTKTDNFTAVDISSMVSGLYFIVVTNNENERQTIKIIKE